MFVEDSWVGPGTKTLKFEPATSKNAQVNIRFVFCTGQIACPHFMHLYRQTRWLEQNLCQKTFDER